jgi:hypothetical protein
MFEFPTTYTLNTGALTDYYTGSGVHLYKDVSLFFDILDPEGSTFLTDAELANSALVKNISFDVLSTGKNLIYENYRSGKTRFIKISEQENINLFGFYQKDFAIRASITNTVNDELFLAEFYLYGNVPSINSIAAYDGSSGSFASGSGVYDKIQLNIRFNNDSNYIKYNRVDVYAHTSALNDVGLQAHGSLDLNAIYSNPYYVYTQPALSDFYENSFSSVIDIPISRISYDVPYYFAVIPYSELGSGDATYFGPLTATRENQDNPGESVFITNQIQLNHGTSSMIMDYITGYITGAINTNTVLDAIPKSSYSTITYTSQISDSTLTVSSSELKIVITATGISSGVSFSEYAISDNDYPIYSYTDSGDYVYLKVSGVSPTGIFKLYKVAL